MSNEMHKKNIETVVWIRNISRWPEHVFLKVTDFE